MCVQCLEGQTGTADEYASLSSIKSTPLVKVSSRMNDRIFPDSEPFYHATEDSSAVDFWPVDADRFWQTGSISDSSPVFAPGLTPSTPQTDLSMANGNNCLSRNAHCPTGYGYDGSVKVPICSLGSWSEDLVQKEDIPNLLRDIQARWNFFESTVISFKNYKPARDFSEVLETAIGIPHASDPNDGSWRNLTSGQSKTLCLLHTANLINILTQCQIQLSCSYHSKEVDEDSFYLHFKSLVNFGSDLQAVQYSLLRDEASKGFDSYAGKWASPHRSVESFSANPVANGGNSTEHPQNMTSGDPADANNDYTAFDVDLASDQPRRRVRHACDTCRISKVKCVPSGTSTACKTCSKRGKVDCDKPKGAQASAKAYHERQALGFV